MIIGNVQGGSSFVKYSLHDFSLLCFNYEVSITQMNVIRWKSSDCYLVLLLYTFELTYTTIASPNCIQRHVQKIRQDAHCYVVV